MALLGMRHAQITSVRNSGTASSEIFAGEYVHLRCQ